ncbi:type VI secretion system-associated protein TagF [Pantoea sp. B65]|uniref:type VI secretion system-associated protein TagF n=1 Tax=Pantoea sp. B65 TaxID=2813359 RepID=UPI0039B6B128
MTSHSTAIIWFGKLPSAGDFLQRRFPEELINQWTHWFQVGLMNWQQNSEERQASGRHFHHAPVWNFVVPPMLGSQLIQMGCLLPACDSIGRHYPICAQRIFTPAQWSAQMLTMAGEWYQRLGSTVLQAVRDGFSAEQLDQALLSIPAPLDPAAERRSDILDVIGYGDGVTSLSWKQVSDCFDPQRYTSFWWSNQTDGYPLYTHVHSGNLTGQLFSMLFDPAAGSRPGRHGLYPPMFD